MEKRETICLMAATLLSQFLTSDEHDIDEAADQALSLYEEVGHLLSETRLLTETRRLKRTL